jgi:hypothetical protein
MRDIVIAPQEQGKGRSFAAVCVATIEADRLWEGGLTATDNMRPVWAQFATSEQELRPFMANLKGGRKAQFIKGAGYYQKKHERLELLKSAGYQVTWQREAEGSIATVFLPELFQLDPGMVDTKDARFIVLPTKGWAASQKIDPQPIVQHTRKMLVDVVGGVIPLTADQLAALVPMAFLFCSYLDRRTRRPLYSDGRFFMQLMMACLSKGHASWPCDDSYRWRHEKTFGRHPGLHFTQDTADAPMDEAIAFHATHEEIDELLSEQVTLFYHLTGGR